MKGNRTAIIVIGLVAVLCLCLCVITLGAGGYYYMNQSAVAGLATRAPAPPNIFTFGVTPTPRANGGPPALPTITGGGTCDDVAEFDDQGNDHIRPGSPHPPYNSNPPTSGWHWADPKDWGIYNTPQVQEQLVHNLEHGGIVIQYNNLSSAELQRLVAFVQKDPHHIVVAPYPGLDSGVRVAFTAWTVSQECDGVDLAALADFIDEFRDQGPESVP